MSVDVPNPRVADLDLTTLAVSVEDGVAVVTLDRPDVYNDFNRVMTE